MSDSSLLSVLDLSANYGARQVLEGINLGVSAGRIALVIGHNGAGKSTLLKTIIGLVPIRRGSIVVSGSAVRRPTPQIMLDLGISYVPQGNRTFSELTVRENLELAILDLSHSLKSTAIDKIFDRFRELALRSGQLAGTLSGGEKQLLSFASAIIRSPKAILLDEPSLGLSPDRTDDAFNIIAELSQTLKIAFVIAEQKVHKALKIADEVYVLRRGILSFHGAPNALSDTDALLEVFF